jgi:transposase-like protein
MQFKDVVKLTEDQAREHLEHIRWPSGAVCPNCGSKEVTKLNTSASTGHKKRDGLHKCRTCRKQFTVTCNTIFEGSHISIKTWLMAFSLMCASKKGISSHQLHRMLGITYKTAWFMSHRIRYTMSQEPLATMLSGGLEADETYVGGKPRNKKKLMGQDRLSNKTPVIAIVERNGRARAKVVRHVTTSKLKLFVSKNADKHSILYTDELPAYRSVARFALLKHETVNHRNLEYARDDATTNSVECFFSLLKRGIMGSFHHVSPWHLQRYCDEFSYRWSYRKADDSDRTTRALAQCEGKRMMYNEPVKKVA